MTFPYIIHDLIWDYCIKMPHCCSVGSHFHIESDKDIKSTSQAIFPPSERSRKMILNARINIQTVVTAGRGEWLDDKHWITLWLIEGGTSCNHGSWIWSGLFLQTRSRPRASNWALPQRKRSSSAEAGAVDLVWSWMREPEAAGSGPASLFGLKCSFLDLLGLRL